MSRAAEMLAAFHAAFDDPQTVELWKRDTLHVEEVRELQEALAAYHAWIDGRSIVREVEPLLANVARELADVVYVAYGTALTLGIDLDRALELVHEANMAKLPDCEACHGTGAMRELDLRGMDAEQADATLAAAQRAGNPPCARCHGTGKGAPSKRSDGKVLKPAGWEPPNMAEAIR